VLERYPGETLAVAAHGTVITLYVTQYTQDDPFTFWDRLGLPSIVVLDLPGREIVEVIEEIT
jgi:broad specificity phosphatase PhoE